MNIDDKDFFIGLCFFMSLQSKDESKESCIVARGRRILSTGFSSIDLLGDFEGSSEKFAISPLTNSSLLQSCDIYIDHTPNPSVLDYLSCLDFKKLIYFETTDISGEVAPVMSSRLLRFNGNLNWIRDKVELMKSFDIFSSCINTL